MILPRLTIDLDAVGEATRRLAADLHARGMTLCGVTKCVDGEPAIGQAAVGEAGCAGALPSVMNAVVDALKPYGITHIDMPATPDRVWQAIQAARAAT